MRWLIFTLLSFRCFICFGSIVENRDLSEFFEGREGCFVLYDSRLDKYVRYNPDGCAKRFSPCSTFKIPNTVIALETGVASGPEFFLPWHGQKSGLNAWDRDQTLRSAFQNSVVWYYQELVRRVGQQREADLVRNLQYGNMDITGGETNFWLESSLLISADEQIEFLKRLWAERLPVSRQAQRLTKEIMEITKRDGRVLFGKTGTGGDRKADIARLGWFVGCITRENDTVYFATRISGGRDSTGTLARKISEEILDRMGHWKRE